MPYPKRLFLLPFAALATAAVAFQGFGPPGPPPPFDDHALMMQKLGLKAIRPGPDPNSQSNHDESVANPYKETLPDVLTLKDGTKVTRPSQWPRRRGEILEDFEREVYGRIPKNAPKVVWEVTGVTPGMSGGIPTVTKTLVGHVDDRIDPKIKVDIQASFTVPAHTTTPVPMMIEFGFVGGFGMPRRPGAPAAKPWGQQAIEHGWGYGTINPNSIQPDNNHLEQGVIGLCNRGGPRKPDDWGALRAWGWGLSRLIDYFEASKDAGVDAKKVGIEGVSRYGKAAAVAEAFDPRVAVALVGSSGEGGTKLHRHVFGEAVENLAGGEYYWMAGNFIKYGASDPKRTAADLPVDSHELIALCAPRPVFISHGTVEKGDAHWIDIHGSFMSAVLAGPVYRLLGKRDLGTPGDYLSDPMPPVGTLIGGDLAWRQHEGGHEVTPNWPAFFEWVAGYVPAPALPQDRTPLRTPADVPASRTDSNSLIAHQQLLQKARQGRHRRLLRGRLDHPPLRHQRRRLGAELRGLEGQLLGLERRRLRLGRGRDAEHPVAAEERRTRRRRSQGDRSPRGHEQRRRGREHGRDRAGRRGDREDLPGKGSEGDDRRDRRSSRATTTWPTFQRSTRSTSGLRGSPTASGSAS